MGGGWAPMGGLLGFGSQFSITGNQAKGQVNHEPTQ